MWPGVPRLAGYPGARAPSRAGVDSSLLQLGHRRALAGMSVKQSGQVFVAGEGGAGERWKRSIIRFTGLTTKKNTVAPMISRVKTWLMKSP